MINPLTFMSNCFGMVRLCLPKFVNDSGKMFVENNWKFTAAKIRAGA